MGNNYNRYSVSNNTGSRGVGVGGVLGIVFIVLKLCGVINWSWKWVLAPFWIPLLILLFLIILYVIIDTFE